MHSARQKDISKAAKGIDWLRFMGYNMTYGEKLIALGLNIAYYRKLRLMTQEQLAEKAKVSISTIRKLENPNMFTGVTFEKICLLANALDITESELLDFRQ